MNPVELAVSQFGPSDTLARANMAISFVDTLAWDISAPVYVSARKEISAQGHFGPIFAAIFLNLKLLTLFHFWKLFPFTWHSEFLGHIIS